VAIICPKRETFTASYERLENIDIYRYPLIYEAGKGVPAILLSSYIAGWLHCGWR
jgi:hypothetical protein